MSRPFMSVLLAMFVCANAAAGQETGTHIWSPPPAEVSNSIRMSDAEKARVTLNEFAACVVGRTPERAKTFVALFPTTKAARKAGNLLSTNDCLNNSIRFDVTLRFDAPALRGAIYRVLYRNEFGHTEPALATVPINYWTDVAGQEPGAANQYVALRQFAECVVRKDSAQSRVLVLAPVASTNEADALKAIVPDLGPCMSQGSRVQFGKSALLGLIAEALYRLSVPSGLANAGIR